MIVIFKKLTIFVVGGGGIIIVPSRRHCAQWLRHGHWDVVALQAVAREVMYVWRNTEARSWNLFYSAIAISITYSECVFVALVIQHTMRMRHIVFCGMSTVFQIISRTARFSGEKRLLYIKYVFWFSLQLSSETFLILRRIERDMIKKMYIGLHVKYRLFFSDFIETWILDKFSKNSNTKFHENPSSRGRVVPCGLRVRQTDRDVQNNSIFFSK